MKFFNINKIIIFSFLTCLVPSNILAENLRLKSFGHSSFLIEGGGQSILINPFKSIGCTSKLKEIKNLKFDYILASSRLADEGFNPNNDLFFVDPGIYKVKDNIINGINIPHDRFEGRRFGMATVWIWNQSNFKIVHMGGAAGDIKINDEILLTHPDLLFISIGGGPKSYNGEEAVEIVNKLKPKIIIPVHFIRGEDNNIDCNLSDENIFLKNVQGYQVKYVDNTILLSTKKIDKNTIYIFK